MAVKEFAFPVLRPLGGFRFLRVKLHQVEAFDKADERIGILGGGGISCSLQSVSPSLVVGDAQLEQALVTFPLQKLGVVLITFRC